VKIKLHLLRQAHCPQGAWQFQPRGRCVEPVTAGTEPGIKELEAKSGCSCSFAADPVPELTDFGRVFMQHAEELVLGPRPRA